MSGRPPKVPEVKHRFPKYAPSAKLKALYAAQDALFRVQPFNVNAFSKLENAIEEQEYIDHDEYDRAKEEYFAHVKAQADSATRHLRQHGIASGTRRSTTKSKTRSKGGGCGCGLRGGYRATQKNKKYLALWKKGKSIGFTMRSSLKAKGLIPRANGRTIVSAKYR
jgi:hypothetical protein